MVNVPIPDWATRLQSETTTAITRDPEINWVLPIYDGMYFAVAPGIEGSGRADEIKTVSFDGSVASLQLIADGVVDGTRKELELDRLVFDGSGAPGSGWGRSNRVCDHRSVTHSSASV